MTFLRELWDFILALPPAPRKGHDRSDVRALTDIFDDEFFNRRGYPSGRRCPYRYAFTGLQCDGLDGHTGNHCARVPTLPVHVPQSTNPSDVRALDTLAVQPHGQFFAGDRVEVRIGDHWFPGTFDKYVGPNKELASVFSDTPGVKSTNTLRNVRLFQSANGGREVPMNDVPSPIVRRECGRCGPVAASVSAIVCPVCNAGFLVPESSQRANEGRELAANDRAEERQQTSNLWDVEYPKQRSRLCNIFWSNTTVYLGDNDFIHCRFDNCKLIDDGPFSMEKCFIEGCTIQTAKEQHNETTDSRTSSVR